MSGFGLIQRIKQLEQQVHDLGFRLDKDTMAWHGDDRGDTVGVFPRDQELPVYAREAMIFSGNINQVETWLRGIVWARDYDSMMKVVPKGSRARKEQDMRNAHTVSRIKNEPVKTRGK